VISAELIFVARAGHLDLSEFGVIERSCISIFIIAVYMYLQAFHAADSELL
jgi:hypothetical protein